MRSIGGSALGFEAIRGFNADYSEAITPLIKQLQNIVTQAAVPTLKGDKQIMVIPQTSAAAVLTAAGDLILRFFVGSDLRSPFGVDGITPLATYPALLNKWLAWVNLKVVEKHTAFMKRNLPQDIQAWLSNRLVREMMVQNPFLNYDAAHTWVDPRGYQLSQRIWQSGIEARRQIDGLLSEGIRTGRSAFDMAADLEPFLKPGMALKRTDKPYGTNASFYAMRLSRTEISYAAANATNAAAYANPFVDGWDWALSAQHPKFDICDKLATIDMKGKRVRDPYPLDGKEPIPVKASHPQCLCNGRTSVSKTNKQIIDELREQMRRNEPAPVTPMDLYYFVKLLIGTYLTNLVWREAVAQ